jgi:hypothetical protein
MKYISVDIETTGLNSELCEVLEIGAIFDDLSQPRKNDPPKFHCYILPDYLSTYCGEPYALAMHSEIFRRIAKQEPPYMYLKSSVVGEEFSAWLTSLGLTGDKKITVAGKNFGSFDLQFLKRLVDFPVHRFNHQFIDPGMLYFDPLIDKCVPNTQTCAKRAGIGSTVAHTALEDADMVISLIRAKYNH